MEEEELEEELGLEEELASQRKAKNCFSNLFCIANCSARSNQTQEH
jgi:hypothetical protein